MKLLILLQHRFELWHPPGWFADRLRQDFPQLQIVQLDSYEGAEKELQDAEILVTWSLRPEQFAVARKLRWIHSTAAAVHGLLIPEVIASDVVVTNASEVHGPVVAEHALAMILALAKKLPQAVRYQSRHIWAKEQLWENRPGPREIAGAALGLIGLGSIGSEVARSAAALGMKVMAIREHPEKGFGALHLAGDHAVFGPAELDRVLTAADYLVLAAPLTGSTQALINPARLATMKPSACLINVARGALVDEAALADALRQHKIAGAALDVFSVEPLAPESPLWDLENVLITPHSAAVTERLWARHYALLSDNLRRYIAGEPLRGIVDKQRGY